MDKDIATFIANVVGWGILIPGLVLMVLVVICGAISMIVEGIEAVQEEKRTKAEFAAREAARILEEARAAEHATWEAQYRGLLKSIPLTRRAIGKARLILSGR